MSNPVTLAVHELEALLEKAKAAAEHIIHPVEAPAPVAVAAPVTSTPVAAVIAVAKSPAKKSVGVKVCGVQYAADGQTIEWKG
jgi:hypothetical protein